MRALPFEVDAFEQKFLARPLPSYLPSLRFKVSQKIPKNELRLRLGTND